MPGDVEFARKWVMKARHDMLNVENNLKADVIPYDTVCFHCQQAAEKLLKAYLIGIGVAPPFTHDLLLLLEEILPSNQEAEKLRDSLAILNPYGVEVRYPDDWFMPTNEDVNEAWTAVNEVMILLQEAMPSLLS